MQKTHQERPRLQDNAKRSNVTTTKQNPGTTDMRPYLLIYRAILVNVIGFALLAIAAVKGWIAELLAWWVP